MATTDLDAPPGEAVMRDATGWLYVVIGAVIIGVLVYILGTFWPH